MTGRRNKWRGWGLAVVLLAAVFTLPMFVVGCGNSPLAPVIPAGDGGGQGGTLKGDPTTVGVVTNLVKNSASKLIGIAGGVLALPLSDNRTTSLTVPPGALLRAVTIVMGVTETQTDRGTLTLYEFGPDGLQFQIPARLTLQSGDANGTLLKLYLWNPATSQWELQESHAVSNGSVTFNVNHFSKYGVSR